MATTSATSSSGIDVNSIVTQLMAIERQPITKLTAKETSYQAKITALGLIQSKVASFQTAVQSLGSSSSSSLLAFKATSSDTTAFSATASSTAVAGTYSLEVTSLAQSQKLVAVGQTSSTAAISDGTATTVTFDFGTITGALNSATGKYSAGPTSTVASGAFTAPTSALGTGTYALTIDGLDLQAPVTVDAGGTVVTAATLDASLTTFLAAHTGYSKTGSFAGNNLVLTKADGTAINIVTTLTGDTAAGTFAGAGFVGTTSETPASFLSNGIVIPPITIDGTNNTLAGIRDAINAANMGVTATIVNDGSATPYRLALSSDSSGISKSLKITTSGGDGTINALLAHDPGGLIAAQHLNQTVAAQNANFKVNGIVISKTSNTVTDAIDGVTLNLSKATTTPATLTVERNTTAVSDAAAGFVKAYNDLYTSMKNSSAYKSKSALEGDATLRSLQTQMRNIANSAVSGGTMTHFFEVGISFQANGVMQLDSAKLASAMSTNFSDVANLFNSATGYATQFDQLATTTLAVDGTFATRTNGINQYIKNIGDQRSALETRMVRLEKQYRATYSNLDLMLSKMSQTSAYLTRQLG